MFCLKCGEQLQEGAEFCPKCGARQGGTDIALSGGASPAVSASDERGALLVQMENSLPVMTAIKEKEDALEPYDSELIEKLEKKASNGRRNLIAVSGLLIYLIGIVITLPIALYKQNKYKKQLEEAKQTKSKYESELSVLRNDAVLSWLPYDYRDSTSFAMLYSYIRNMRANSLKEAINLLETEKHQARVELMTALSAQSAEDAASAAKGAAASAAASAFFSLFK